MRQVVKGAVLGQRAVEEAARAGEALAKSEKFTNIGKLAEGAEKFLNGFELGQHVGVLVRNVRNSKQFSAAADELVRAEIKDAAAGVVITATQAIREESRWTARVSRRSPPGA